MDYALFSAKGVELTIIVVLGLIRFQIDSSALSKGVELMFVSYY